MWHILNLHNSICTHTDRYVCILYAWCVYVYIYMNKLRSKTETNVTIYIVTEQNVIHFLIVYKWYKYEERGKKVDCGLNALTATQFSVRTNVTVRDQKHSQQYFSVPLIKKWESIFPLPELSTGFHQHNVAKVMVYKLKTSSFKRHWSLYLSALENTDLTPSCKEADLVNMEKNLSTRVNSGQQQLHRWVKP